MKKSVAWYAVVLLVCGLFYLVLGGQSKDCVDDDGDGYAVCSGDCDDGDALINPAAEEVCDAVDNNCDGETDEGDCEYCEFLVPEDYQTIQEGIYASFSGDTVLVQPGLYVEHVGTTDHRCPTLELGQYLLQARAAASEPRHPALGPARVAAAVATNVKDHVWLAAQLVGRVEERSERIAL